MTRIQTLIELIEQQRRRDRGIVYIEGEDRERRVSNGELYERALGILHHLQRLGAGRGDKLILFLADNEQFIDAFWAGLLGGIVPVPVAIGISDEHRHKLFRIAGKLGQPYLYTDRKSLGRLRSFAEQNELDEVFSALERRTFLVDDLSDVSRAGRTAPAAADDIAFIQFSSGSTSEPKGVVLTHRNILANAEGASVAAGFHENEVSLSWMPLTHDMGLIGFHLIMLANSIHQHLMATELFIRRPLLWMEFCSRRRVSVTCSPNFGYRHFLKMLGDRPVDGWDLSSVRLIFNGAEPISVEVCEQFLKHLAPAGLDRRAMFPVYGLAEASLAVSFPAPGTELGFRTFDRHRLGVGEQAREIGRDAREALDVVCEGRTIPHCELRLTDDDDREIADGYVGHVQIRGLNVTAGYFEAPDINARSFTEDGWLRTGDLALRLKGELYITGRAKDIIFVNGQNYYPHDLETIAQRASGLDLNKLAASAVRRSHAESEEIAIFVLHRGSAQEFLPTALEVTRLVNERTGLDVRYVVPVKRIPKTTSGKLQRHLLAQAFADGEFDGELAELDRLRAAASDSGDLAGVGSRVRERLKAICDAALSDRRVDVDDNLFEIGVSSLKLIEIHEQIDREFPGQVDLTELFDHPTIADLARHLEQKLARDG